jgi:16S rRNA (guanine527-N7)-methyltransferase
VSVLTQGLTELDIPWKPEHIEKLHAYLTELSLWNKRKRLVDARGRTLIINHVLDSLSALPLLYSWLPTSLADIGSGAGFPGIPLSIFLQETQVTLVERSSKKASFLKLVKAQLGLSNLEIICGSVERLTSSFSVVTARACTKIDTIVPTLIRITKSDGSVLLYKGRSERIDEEMKDMALSELRWEKRVVHVPYSNLERHLVLIYPI